MKLSARPRVNRGPARLAVVLQAGHIRAEERRKLTLTPRTAAFIADLIVEYVWLDFDTLLDVRVLQLHESGANGRNVGLLVAERHSTGALRILQLWISVDAGIAKLEWRMEGYRWFRVQLNRFLVKWIIING